MKPEVSERLFMEELFKNSKERLGRSDINLNKIERLTGDASTRRYYRLFTNEQTFVACLDNPSELERNSFVNIQHFLEENKVRVPKIFDMNLFKGYMLQEDLGNQTLLQKLSAINSLEEEYEVYKKIIDVLLKIHSVEEKRTKDSSLFNESFDFKKLNYEIEFTVGYYFKKFLNITDENIMKNVVDEFKPVCERLAKQKMVPTHRDFHSRNIMVKDGEYIVIDFQDARMGIPQYDLVSVLEDCYYAIDPRNKERLIQYYYENLDEKIHGQKTFSNFMKLYDDMLLQRVFKAIGSFSYIHETRKDVRYIKYIGFAMEKIRTCMTGKEEYSSLRKLLLETYYAS